MSDHLGEAWCSQHDEHPNDCFGKHRPDVKEVKGALTSSQHEAAIMKAHIRKQIENEMMDEKIPPAPIPMEDENAQ